MSRSTCRSVWIAGIVALTVAVSAAGAAGPVLWTQAGKELARGRADGVAVTVDGRVELAPPLRELVKTDSPRIWSMVATPAGVFYGAGEDGRVWRRSPDGEETVVLALDGESRAAQAMAMGPDGSVYVAFGPQASIYRIAGDGSSSSEPWAVLEQRYAWAMAFDAAGRLLVGTGDDGRILRFDDEGQSETLYDSPEPHVTALLAADDGAVYAGSEGSAYVYRIGADGDVMVLLDAPHGEITALAWRHGALWVAAAGSTAGGAEPAVGDTVRVSTASVAAANGNGSASDRGQGGAVYRIAADGLVDLMWTSDRQVPYAIAGVDAGVVVGTGPQARLLLLGEDPGDEGLLADLRDGQVVGLSGGSPLVVALGAPGRIVSLGDGHRVQGALESAVRDAGATSRWGTIRWSAEVPRGTTLQFRTRSGNSGVPDDTWSEWSAPLAESTGSPIASPPARFLQWKAEMTSEASAMTPRLRRVEAAHVTHNRRPQIDTLTAHPAGVVYRENSGFEDGLPFAQVPSAIARELRESGADSAAAAAGGRSFLGRPYFVAGLRTISWEAGDADGDALAFDISMRQESAGDSWMPMATALSASSLVVDTRKLPDGHYEVRVVVSDAPAWPAGESLRASRSLAGILVDNTAPEAEGLTVVRADGGARLRGRFVDRSSLIGELQYSVDGGEWITVGAADGAADSAAEEVDVVLAGLDDGAHVVIVKAVDTALNAASARVLLPARQR